MEVIFLVFLGGGFLDHVYLGPSGIDALWQLTPIISFIQLDKHSEQRTDPALPHSHTAQVMHGSMLTGLNKGCDCVTCFILIACK